MFNRTRALLALPLMVGLLAAPAAHADWRDHGGRGYGGWGHYGRGYGPGAAVVAGILGLGVGAAVVAHAVAPPPVYYAPPPAYYPPPPVYYAPPPPRYYYPAY